MVTTTPTSTTVKKPVVRKQKVQNLEPEVHVQEVKVQETQETEVDATEVESVRSRLESLLRVFEEDKRRATENIASVRNTMKVLIVEQKSANGKKRVKRVRDPSKPAAKNGIAKPQTISEDLGSFLNKHFQVPKGSQVSRTGALSKDNGLSKYITDKQLRKDGEIHPDGELVKLLGNPTDMSKDGKTKVFYHKSLMKLIGRHFPESKASAAAREAQAKA